MRLEDFRIQLSRGFIWFSDLDEIVILQLSIVLTTLILSRELDLKNDVMATEKIR